jgi:hypothetical protein
VADSKGSQVSDQEGWENELEVRNEVLYILVPTNSWYYDIKYYLTHGTSPQYLEPKKKRALRLKYAKYQLIDGVLFRKIMIMCFTKMS